MPKGIVKFMSIWNALNVYYVNPDHLVLYKHKQQAFIY